MSDRRELAGPPTRNTYVRASASLLWENSPLLLLGGFVFTLLCFPAMALFMLGLFIPAAIVAVLIVAPGWAALLALETQIAQGGQATILVMLKALPKFWVRSMGVACLALFPVCLGLLTLPILSGPAVPFVVWVGLAGDGVGLLLLAAVYLYVFPLLVLYDTSIGTALWNALILASHHLSNTLGLLSMGVLFGWAIVRFNAGLLLVLPAVWGMFIVNNCRMVMAEETVE